MNDYDWTALKAWGLDILSKATPGEWVIPQTYSMRQAMDYIWADEACEKSWVNGENAYRLPASRGAA